MSPACIQCVNHSWHVNFVASAESLVNRFLETAKICYCNLTGPDAEWVKTDGWGLMREMKCLNEVLWLGKSSQSQGYWDWQGPTGWEGLTGREGLSVWDARERCGQSHGTSTVPSLSPFSRGTSENDLTGKAAVKVMKPLSGTLSGILILIQLL